MSFLRSLISKLRKNSPNAAECAQLETEASRCEKEFMESYDRRIDELLAPYFERREQLSAFHDARNQEIQRALANSEISEEKAKRELISSDNQFQYDVTVAYCEYDRQLEDIFNERDQRLAILRHSFKRARF